MLYEEYTLAQKRDLLVRMRELVTAGVQFSFIREGSYYKISYPEALDV